MNCALWWCYVSLFFKQLDLDSAIPRLEEGRYAAQSQVTPRAERGLE